jgi:hypothetical protein
VKTAVQYSGTVQYFILRTPSVCRIAGSYNRNVMYSGLPLEHRWNDCRPKIKVLSKEQIGDQVGIFVNCLNTYGGGGASQVKYKVAFSRGGCADIPRCSYLLMNYKI